MGLSYTLAGASRLFIYGSKLVSPLSCLFRPYMVLFILNDTAAGVLPLLTAIQTYHIIAHPLSELQHYSGCAILYPTVLTVLATVSAYVYDRFDDSIWQSSICMLNDAVPFRIYSILKYTTVILVFLAVIIYAAFVVTYYRHYSHIAERAGNWYKPFISVGIMVSFLVIFTVIPNLGMLYVQGPTWLFVFRLMYFGRCFVNMYIFAATKSPVMHHIFENIPLIGHKFRPPSPDYRCRYNIETDSTGAIVQLNLQKISDARPPTAETSNRLPNCESVERSIVKD
uniref:G_PROTEIN_RECEP_F1_2 domain-containing protein n=1 Tax=Panagrellus redivivus TaxID=6233 RepID=A0A7E4UTB6_PANRE